VRIVTSLFWIDGQALAVRYAPCKTWSGRPFRTAGTEREPIADHAVKRRVSLQQPIRSQQSDPQPASKIL